MGGRDPRAGTESPLGDQTGSGRLGLKISKRLSDIFKERVWWVGERKPEGHLGHEEVGRSSKALPRKDLTLFASIAPRFT